MEIRIHFMGGLIDGAVAYTDRLEPVKLLFDDAARTIAAFRRENETGYLFDPALSWELSADYEAEVAKFYKVIEPASLRFEEGNEL